MLDVLQLIFVKFICYFVAYHVVQQMLYLYLISLYKINFLFYQNFNQRNAIISNTFCPQVYSKIIVIGGIQEANRQPTVSQPSANRQPTVSQLSANRQPTVYQPSANLQPTVSQPPANRQPTVSQPSANRQPTASQPPANRQPTAN